MIDNGTLTEYGAYTDLGTCASSPDLPHFFLAHHSALLFQIPRSSLPPVFLAEFYTYLPHKTFFNLIIFLPSLNLGTHSVLHNPTLLTEVCGNIDC